MKCVISVLGKDRSGIVAAVATTLAQCNANIDDISQTILGDDEIFSMTMLVTLDPETAGFNEVQQQLEQCGQALGVQVIIQREDVFQFMYKI
ncbi:ACT domain-containing protein [Parvibacter caecicola]|uniref:ACT domain-containing protein n=1 Tax=Parvibacter caecicola TaxID=747645 RepID=A0A3N0AAM7_9ACTN|nr:ACT domain-containing protein [Parvibacter caecicola]MBB3170968.1 ACT domain-containing protein [Parvibacter caecicola]MCR2040576.1 ACT domain-containing protein [Parvibacter caecicola]RNL09503.1 ACT domain-containing protein [Parvibacter caecicola]TJW09995.1 ACT domain-containing protein [Parvibacter caecicola]